jgi:hypothetical protein
VNGSDRAHSAIPLHSATIERRVSAVPPARTRRTAAQVNVREVLNAVGLAQG